MFILKEVKVICFDTLLQVLILKVVMEEQFCRRSFSLDKSPGCPVEAFGYPPPRVFCEKRLQVIDSKGREHGKEVKEAPRV